MIGAAGAALGKVRCEQFAAVSRQILHAEPVVAQRGDFQRIAGTRRAFERLDDFAGAREGCDPGAALHVVTGHVDVVVG